MSEPFDVIDRAARVLREPVSIDPAAKRRLVEALRAAPQPRRSAVQRAWRWLARPRQIMVSPLAGLAVAAAAVLVVVLQPATGLDESPSGATAAESGAAPPSIPDAIPVSLAGAASSAEAEQPRHVRFIFLAPTASSVSLVGDFNGWDPGATPLRAGSDPGVWVVEVPLEPGRHVYSYIVDGQQWHPDPLAARAPESDVDAPSSVVLVGRAL